MVDKSPVDPDTRLQDNRAAAPDSRVLGELLTILPFLLTLSSEQQMAEFVSKALCHIPGITASRICLPNGVAQWGSFLTDHCLVCPRFSAVSFDQGVFPPDLYCHLENRPQNHILRLETVDSKLGFVVCLLSNEKAFVPYSPFLSNLGNYFALLLENRRQKIALKEVADHRFRLLAAIVESSNDAIIGKDLDACIISWNKAAEYIYGYSAEEVLGRPVAILIPPNHPDELPAIMTKLKRGEVISNIATERIRKDGRILYVSLTISPVRDAQEKIVGFSTITRDVTEHRKAEVELQRINRTLHMLTDCNQILIRATNESELLNEICRIIVEAGAYPLAWVDFFDQSDVRRRKTVARAGMEIDALDPLKAKVSDHEIGHWLKIEGECRKELGSADQPSSSSLLSLPLVIDGATIGALNVFKDGEDLSDTQETTLLKELAGDLAFGISTLRRRNAHVQAEAELQLFRHLLNQSNDAIFVIDPDTSRILDINHTACRMLNYSREELLRLHITDIDPAMSSSAWAQTLAVIESSRSLTVESRHQRKDGVSFPVEISVNYTVLDCQAYLIAVVRNITARKQLEEQEQLTREILELLNRGEGVTDLVREILLLIKKNTGLKAVGIRLREGDDFPYYETEGFPEEFVQAERHLCAQDDAGKIVRDGQGNPVLECMCGNVLCGRTDPSLPFFTDKGSFWTNSTTKLLTSTSEKDRQARTRNRCNNAGYESVALIPLRSGDETLGLLQLNDYRQGMFTLEMIQFFENLGASIGIAVMRQRTQGALHRLNRELRAIGNCNQTLLHAMDEQTLLNEICRIICDDAGYLLAWVGYAENDAVKTVRPVAWMGSDSCYIANAKLSWAGDTERGRGPAGTVIRSGEIFYSQDFTTDPYIAPWLEAALQRGYRSGIALPLKDENRQVFGVLLIYSGEAKAITPEEIRLLEELSNDLAFGIINLRARAEHKRAEEITLARIRLARFALTHSLDELLQATLDEVERLTDSTIGFFHFLEADQRTLSLQNWSTRTLAEFCTAEGKGRHYDLDQAGVWVDCIRERRAVIHNDYASLPQRKGLPKGHVAIIREVVFPLFRGDQIVAILGAGNKPQNYDERDIQTISLLADLTWDITERKRVEENIQRLNLELDQRVKERTAELEAKNKELERMNRLFVNRELRMIELKQHLKRLEGELRKKETSAI